MHQFTEIGRVDKRIYQAIICLQETHFKYTELVSLMVREWKNIYHANINQRKEAGVAT